MGWLVGYTLASMAVAFIVIKIFDYIVGEATSGLLSLARTGLFIITWTVITAKGGMHGVTRQVRQLRQGNTKALQALTKNKWP